MSPRAGRGARGVPGAGSPGLEELWSWCRASRGVVGGARRVPTATLFSEQSGPGRCETMTFTRIPMTFTRITMTFSRIGCACMNARNETMRWRRRKRPSGLAAERNGLGGEHAEEGAEIEGQNEDEGEDVDVR
eukprot:1873859-Rhodomonas_salina.2